MKHSYVQQQKGREEQQRQVQDNITKTVQLQLGEKKRKRTQPREQ